MNLACIDIETTGTIACVHEVIEIGVVLLDGHTLKPTLEWECSLPFDEELAEPEALEVNGWGKREFAEQLDHDMAIRALWDIFGGYKRTAFIGMHAHFDSSFLECMMVRYAGEGEKYDTPWRKHVYDIPSMMCGRLRIAPPMRSNYMTDYIGLNEPEKHRALADARTNAEIVRWLELWPPRND